MGRRRAPGAARPALQPDAPAGNRAPGRLRGQARAGEPTQRDLSGSVGFARFDRREPGTMAQRLHRAGCPLTEPSWPTRMAAWASTRRSILEARRQGGDVGITDDPGAWSSTSRGGTGLHTARTLKSSRYRG